MSCVVGVVTPALLAAGFALAAGLTVGATYAWAAQDVAWIVSYGTATLLALVLPLAILVLHERRQVERGDISGPAGASTTPIWAWELFATLPGLLACPFILLAAWCAWMFWIDGLPAASVYFAFIALAAIADESRSWSSTSDGGRRTGSSPEAWRRRADMDGGKEVQERDGGRAR